MGFYERLLEKRAEEEKRRGRPLGTLYGLESPVLDRRLANAPKDRPTGYAADLSTMHRLITRGVHSAGAGIRLGSLRARYPKEYAEFRAQVRGQGQFL